MPPRRAARLRDDPELLEDSPGWMMPSLTPPDAVLKGFSAQEFSGWEWWGLQLPKGIVWRDPLPGSRPTRMTGTRLRLRDGSSEGRPSIPFGWIMQQGQVRNPGYPARTGLIRTLVWPSLFKNYSVRDLAEFLEIYGLPVRLQIPGRGHREGEKATLLQAVPPSATTPAASSPGNGDRVPERGQWPGRSLCWPVMDWRASAHEQGHPGAP